MQAVQKCTGVIPAQHNVKCRQAKRTWNAITNQLKQCKGTSGQNRHKRPTAKVGDPSKGMAGPIGHCGGRQATGEGSDDKMWQFEDTVTQKGAREAEEISRAENGTKR